MEITAPDSFVYPASYFVFAYLGLLSIIAVVAIILSRRRGDLDDEEIKYKVFEDGIPNPRTEPEFQLQRGRPVPTATGTDDSRQR